MTTVVRGYKTELDLNNAQITACLQHAGTARFAYNWGLRRYQEEYAAGNRTPNAISLHKELNALKKTDFPWMYDVSKSRFECGTEFSRNCLMWAYRELRGNLSLWRLALWLG